MIEINSPFRKGNQETTEETMEEFHRLKKTDIYIYIYKENKLNNINMQNYHLLKETLSFQKPMGTKIS